jgi:hypothetical protein
MVSTSIRTLTTDDSKQGDWHEKSSSIDGRDDSVFSIL